MRISTVCYLGTYDRLRERNRIMMTGLRQNGIAVVECHFDIWGGVDDKSRLGAAAVLLRVLKYILAPVILAGKYIFCVPDHDAVIVGYMGHVDVLWARFLSRLRGKPLIWDAYMSLYETVIEDRGLADSRSFYARLLFRLDSWACRLADRIILDTREHARYFERTFSVGGEKLLTVYVGAEDSFFETSQTPRDAVRRVIVLFYGQFIPLQGVPRIIEAARILRGHDWITFRIAGTGQEDRAATDLLARYRLSNVERIPWIRYADLPQAIDAADICLGIFGNTPKAGRVIPNKVYQCMARGKAVVSISTPALLELFQDGPKLVRVRPDDDGALAEAILGLASDPGRRASIGREAKTTSGAMLRPKNVVQPLIGVLTSLKGTGDI